MSELLYHPDLDRFYEATSPGQAAVLRRSGWTDAAGIADQLPPRSGSGSGKQAWIGWADRLGIRVTDDDTRETLARKVEERLGIDDVPAEPGEGEPQGPTDGGDDDKEQ